VDFFIGVVYRDSQAVVNAISSMDAFTEESDITNFKKSIDILIGKYLDKPMDKIKMTHCKMKLN
jgi:predicted unusual protein kinase regulating ubiquinone biosynthesis (AarF/ABC1/UbiB family)